MSTKNVQCNPMQTKSLSLSLSLSPPLPGVRVCLHEPRWWGEQCADQDRQNCGYGLGCQVGTDQWFR
jgi:hypothetical protein